MRFDEMHDMARHGIHMSEVLEVSGETLARLQTHQAAIRGRLQVEIAHNYRQQADEYAQFQVQMLKNLHSRSNSNNKRLQNEITLVR
jgi:hypothetical protein